MIKMKKKAISFVLAVGLGLLAGMFAASPAFAASLSDISAHWAEPQILAGINYGYIKGHDDGTFKPEDPITRAQFVTIINSARNYTAMTNIPFRDVSVGAWYFADVQKAYSAGYILGDDEGNFNPGAQITRQEVAVILNRIAPGGDTSYALTGVLDANKIDSWALPAVRAAYSKGYITGEADGSFGPQSPLKRCQAVVIVNRMLGISPLTPGTELAALSISNINVTDIKTDGATLSVTSTRDGNVYWVVLTGDDATTPTAQQILNGRTADEKNAYGTGSRSVYANSALSVSLTSLQSEQSYKVCAVVRDAAANLSPVAIRTFTSLTAGDTGEEWLGSNFTVSNIGNNSLTLTVNSSRAGTLYYVIAEDPNRTVKTPTQAYIKNGRDANNSSSNVISGNFSVSAGSSKSVDVTGLKAGTNYKIFGCVYESSSSNSLYSTVKNRTFTTTGSNVDWITTFEVPSSTVGTTSATLNVRANRTGTFYYVVTTDSRQPTLDQLRNLRDYNSSNVFGINGSSSINSASTTYPISLSNLTVNTRCYVFGVLYISSSEYSEIETLNFVTGTGAAPTLSVSYTLSATTGGAIRFSNSGVYYTADNAIPLSGDNSGASVRLSVTKSSSASYVAAKLDSKTLTATTGDTIFDIPNGNLSKGRNTVTLTVSEQGKSTLYYYIYIDI
jgi:hypothetical protein